jgi:hypothetical protein
MSSKDETEYLTAQVSLSSDTVTKFVRQRLKKLDDFGRGAGASGNSVMYMLLSKCP